SSTEESLKLDQQLAAVRAELAAVGNLSLCAACGWSISRTEPDWRKKMTAHILNCEPHPLNQLKKSFGEICTRIDAALGQIEREHECGGIGACGVCEALMEIGDLKLPGEEKAGPGGQDGPGGPDGQPKAALKMVTLDGDALFFRVLENGRYEDRLFVRDDSQPQGNNCWKQLYDYREFIKCAGPVGQKDGAALIAEERRRQITEEGWTEEHDAQHTHGQLAHAAVAYILEEPYRFWPLGWAKEWWKPDSSYVRNLTKAGALIAAEIDRLQALTVQVLLVAEGHNVYDFKNPGPENHGFHWSEIDADWKNWTAKSFVKNLRHPIATRGFNQDFEAMQGADACVLVLPCGRSAHLEAGWFIGQGRLTIILTNGPTEPELMYRMAVAVCTDIEDVCDILRGYKLDTATVKIRLAPGICPRCKTLMTHTRLLGYRCTPCPYTKQPLAW
ncbi:MAG: hypothetical protein NTY53_23985, partial [Kiritimatiellaeota bacterium]|nr:hypothetical protein [Kiritimatiellota bacterium]